MGLDKVQMLLAALAVDVLRTFRNQAHAEWQ
jgi:hypothetical protein